MRRDTALAVVGDVADDDRVCREILARGSRSFAAASWLLAPRLRRPVAALYAFCRVADDAIDDGGDPAAALTRLSALLDRIYTGAPAADPVERSLGRVVHDHGVARPVLDALLDGFAADVRGDPIDDLDALLAYAVRVASTVGVAMTLIMGVRDRSTLARASDLGVAMQLTNIARDVGEDARRGRAYLPATWFREVGIDRTAWLASPRFEAGIAQLVDRVLDLADAYYRRADVGIAALPRDCQAAIRAARWIYADIGRVIRARGCDSVNGRARTSVWRKLVLLTRARWWTAAPDPAPSRPPAIPLAAALVDACVGPGR